MKIIINEMEFKKINGGVIKKTILPLSLLIKD